MVHELIGIEKNRVDLSEVPGISKDMREVVMSPEQDTFFKDSLYSDFGEIGIKIKDLVDQFQKKQHSTANIESISDMKKFVDNYPQFKKFSGLSISTFQLSKFICLLNSCLFTQFLFILGTVSKHVAIVGELSRIVQDCNLLEVSETEQSMTAQASHSEIQQKVCLTASQDYQTFHKLLIYLTLYFQIVGLIRNPKVREIELLRLVLLYCICYEGQSGHNPRQLIDTLRSRGVGDAKCKVSYLIIALLESQARD